MTRTLFAAIAAAFAFAFAAACGGDPAADPTGSPSPTSGTPEATPTPTDAPDPTSEPTGLPALTLGQWTRDGMTVTLPWEDMVMYDKYNIIRDVPGDDGVHTELTVVASPFVDELPTSGLLIQEIHYAVCGVTPDGRIGPASNVIVPPDFSWLNGTFTCRFLRTPHPSFKAECQVLDGNFLHCDSRTSVNRIPLGENGMNGFYLVPPDGFDLDNLVCRLPME